MNVHSVPHIDAYALAGLLRGEVGKGKKGDPAVRAPGPNNKDPKDRSMTVIPGIEFPDGFYVESFSAKNTWQECRDYVAATIGLPKWTPETYPADMTDRINRTFFNGAKPQPENGASKQDDAPKRKPFDDRHLLNEGFKHVATYDYAVDGRPSLPGAAIRARLRGQEVSRPSTGREWRLVVGSR